MLRTISNVNDAMAEIGRQEKYIRQLEAELRKVLDSLEMGLDLRTLQNIADSGSAYASNARMALRIRNILGG